MKALSLVPAAAMRGTGSAELDPAETLFGHHAAQAAIDKFETAVGGRDALVGELLIAPDLNDRTKTLINLTFDPQFADKSLGYLCAKAGMTPGEVFLTFRDVLGAKATIEAMRVAAAKIVEVVSEIVNDAISHQEMCADCNGKGRGQIVRPRRGRPAKAGAAASAPTEDLPCSACHGTGQILVKADRDAQKLVLELATVLKKSQGTQVNVGVQQTNHNQAAASGSGFSTGAVQSGLAQLQQAVAGIAFSPRVTTPVAPSTPSIIDVPDTTVSGGASVCLDSSAPSVD